MIVYEYTKDCGYETRTASIFSEPVACLIFIEGSRDIYEFETETLEDAIALVKRYGFEVI